MQEFEEFGRMMGAGMFGAGLLDRMFGSGGGMFGPRRFWMQDDYDNEFAEGIQRRGGGVGPFWEQG